MNDGRAIEHTPVLMAAALEQAPFSALICRADADLTVLWRNRAHAIMSGSEGQNVTGLPMFHAFPPNTKGGGDAAVAALLDARDALLNGTPYVDIGPYRFDLPGKSGGYVEHHWQIQMSPIHTDGTITAILQVAQDVTHKVLEQRLAESHRRSTKIAAAASYFSYDPETDIFVRSADVDALFGFAPNEAGPLAAPFFSRVAPEDLEGVRAEIARVMDAPRGEIASFDYRIHHPDGGSRFVRIRGEVATDPRDRRPRLVGIFVDLTDIEERRKELAALVDMKEALLSEANHRIKNSLQMALSMLRLEAGQLRGETDAAAQKARDAMAVAESRIRSIASIHGMMRLDENVARVDLDGLLGDLVENTRATVGMQETALTLEGPPLAHAVNSDSAIAFGLIMNELLTNAIKNGWSAQSTHPVRITRDREGDQGILMMENIILGADERAMSIPSSGLGSELVAGFIEQIGGEIENHTDGTTYRVRLSFPLT